MTQENDGPNRCNACDMRRVSSENCRQWRGFVLIFRSCAEKVAIDKTLDMRMQVRFGLLDDEECVVALPLGDETVEFEALQRVLSRC